jgi:hypothetical protein
MARAGCEVCRELFDAAEFRIKEHLAATAKITAAQVQNAGPAEISALEEALRLAAEARAKAVADYRRHRDQHSQRAAAAD